MPEAHDAVAVAAAARTKHDQAIINYLEAIRVEVHDLPGRIVWRFVLLGATLGVIAWLATAMLAL